MACSYTPDWGDLAVAAGQTTTATSITAGNGMTYTIGTDTSTIGTTLGYVTNGYISTYGGSSYSLGYDKSIIIGKEGDILMDLKNMKFKVYCSEKGWIEYDIEDFSTKNKKVELNGSKEMSVCETIIERSNRKVLIEKMPKKKEPILIDNGIWVDGNIGIWADGNGGIGTYTGDNIGTYTINMGGYNTVGNNVNYCTNNTVTFNGNTEIGGNLTVNGDINVTGTITVNGNKISQ